jgi:hypothetical protein
MGGTCRIHGTEKRNTYSILVENVKDKNHSEFQGVDVKIILE